MANLLSLVRGVPRAQTSASTSLIYDQSITIVASGGNGSTTLNGPVTASTAITLPSAGSYTLNTNSIANLNVYLNGNKQLQSSDWNTSGAGPTYTAITMAVDLVVGDRLEFRIERNS